MPRKALVIFFLFCLTGCGNLTLPLHLPTPQVSPSALPGIISPTPRFSATVTPLFTQTFTPTLTASTTFTASPTLTPAGELKVDILACNTSLDILHGFGEVTNAFPVIQNTTPNGLTDVCATLAASDEARKHPDKTVCTPALPPGYQVMLKVTVDTGFKQDTSIDVGVTTQQGLTAVAYKPSCRDLGMPGWVPGKVGLVEPIP